MATVEIDAAVFRLLKVNLSAMVLKNKGTRLRMKITTSTKRDARS